jgi:hypothetical protein
VSNPANPVNKLHLYSQPRGNFYVHVFVRIVFDLNTVSPTAWRSCAGTAATAGIAVANSRGQPFTIANA